MEERKYYICWVKLKRKNLYFIWYSDELDGIVLSSDQKLLAFSNQDLAREFAKQQKIKLENEVPVLLNLDIVQNWLHHPGRDIDCVEFLNAWNLFTDVSTSLNS